MFGLFRKDFEIHIDSAIDHCSEFYKMGISTNHDELTDKYKHTYKNLYEKLDALKSSYTLYLINSSGRAQDQNDKFSIRDIVHFITYCDAFAYGYAGRSLDERTLRRTAKNACSMLFEDTRAFQAAQFAHPPSSYREKFSALENHYFQAYPSETSLLRMMTG